MHRYSSSVPAGGQAQKDEERTVIVALVASPEHCQRVATDIEFTLPDALSEHIDEQVTWKISNIANPLAGSQVAEHALLDEVAQHKQGEDWQYAISLTDLPLRHNESVGVGGVDLERQVAYISVSALGVIRLRARVQNLVVELVNEMRSGTPRERDEQGQEIAETQAEPFQAAQNIISRGIAQQVAVADAEGRTGIRYVAPRVIGHVRLLSGMVYTNRPWTLFPNLRTAMAAALATGGYILIFSTMWEIGNAYTIWRLALLMITAMAVLTIWIVLSHDLWENQRGATSQYLATIYNLSTVLTVVTGVVMAYIIVFILLFAASALYVPDEMLGEMLGETVTWMNYLHIGWVAASVATIAGALGAGLEDTNAVRDATFGWRQRHRFEQYQQERTDE